MGSTLDFIITNCSTLEIGNEKVNDHAAGAAVLAAIFYARIPAQLAYYRPAWTRAAANR